VNVGAPETTPVLRVAGRTWAARILVWPLCVAVVVVHFVMAHDDFPTAARLYAGLLACVAVLCVAYAPIRVVPALAIGMSYFYAALGAPVFARGTTFSVFGPIRLPPSALQDATLAALLFACVVVASATISDRATRRVAWGIARRLEGGETYGLEHTVVARTLAFFALGVKLALVMNVNFGSLKQPANLFSAPVIVTTLLFWDAEQTKRTSARYLFWITVGVQWVLGMMSGMMGNALAPPVMAAALLWARRGHLPAGLLAAGACAFLIFNPAKVTYRKITWFTPETTSLERFTNWGDALWITYFDRENDGLEDVGTSFENSLGSAAMRLNTLGQVAQMFDWVPERVPHAGPDRWLTVPKLLMPRALWPDKPIQEEFFNKNYTFQFRLQTPQAAASGTTSITLPSVGDGYWRLGWPGVAIEAAFLGLIIGWAQAVGRGGVSRIASRTSLLLAASLMQLHTDLHTFGLLNGALQQLVVALVVAWVAKWMADLLAAPSLAPAQGQV